MLHPPTLAHYFTRPAHRLLCNRSPDAPFPELTRPTPLVEDVQEDFRSSPAHPGAPRRAFPGRPRLYTKLFTIDPTTRYHPSAKTNRISLNGSEMTIGGNSIMPIDIRTLATTISTIKNGM